MKYYPGWASDTAHRIARDHGFTIEELRERKRTPERVEARRLIAQHLRDAKWSLPRIGAFLHRDHTTILYLLGGTPAARAMAARRKALEANQEAAR